MSNDRLIKLLQATPAVQAEVDLVLNGKTRPHCHQKPAEPLLLGMGAAAKYLGVSRATLWRMVRSGALKKVEFMPGSYRIRRADLDAIAANNTGGSDE